MSHFGDHLGLPEALLEPSWAKKYCLTPRGPPVQVKGRVGGVNTSPKGKKEAGRGNSLLHLRPKGLVGFYPHRLQESRTVAARAFFGSRFPPGGPRVAATPASVIWISAGSSALGIVSAPLVSTPPKVTSSWLNRGRNVFLLVLRHLLRRHHLLRRTWPRRPVRRRGMRTCSLPL